MSEREFLAECVPMMVEMVVECRKMSQQEYEDWKREVMEAVPDKAKDFMRKVLICIDEVLRDKGVIQHG